jgi:hypothetical protein
MTRQASPRAAPTNVISCEDEPDVAAGPGHPSAMGGDHREPRSRPGAGPQRPPGLAGPPIASHLADRPGSVHAIRAAAWITRRPARSPCAAQHPAPLVLVSSRPSGVHSLVSYTDRTEAASIGPSR